MSLSASRQLISFEQFIHLYDHVTNHSFDMNLADLVQVEEIFEHHCLVW